MEAFTDEYAVLRADAQATMRDRCRIGVRGESVTTDPADVTWTYGAEMDCGLLITTSGELAQDGSQATITNAILRLPWGTAISAKDRVEITQHGGETVSLFFAVDGAPYGAIVNVIVRLKRLTGASAS